MLKLLHARVAMGQWVPPAAPFRLLIIGRPLPHHSMLGSSLTPTKAGPCVPGLMLRACLVIVACLPCGFVGSYRAPPGPQHTRPRSHSSLGPHKRPTLHHSMPGLAFAFTSLQPCRSWACRTRACVGQGAGADTGHVRA